MTDTPDQPGSDQPRDPLWERPAPSSARLGPTPPVEPPPAGVGPSVQWDEPAEKVEEVVPAPSPPQHKRGRRKPRSSVRSAVEWVAVIVGALVVALVVKTFLFQAFYIPSASMEPTLRKGDRVLVNKLSYDLHDLHRGDIVVFELPPEKVGADGIKDLIKRVIGLPGETIETREGIVYINDKKIDEPYLPDGVTTNKPPIPRQVVPDGHIFVMGDNRDNSADSRYATRGPIPIDTVVGRAFVQVWPPSRAGGL
jgi:signal peptidase I